MKTETTRLFDAGYLFRSPFSLLNTGIHFDNEPARNRQIRAVNFAGICGCLVALWFCALNAFAGFYLLSLFNIFTAVCMLGMIFFNKKGLYELGPMITLPVCSFELTLSSLLFNNNMEFYLILIICLSLILFNNKIFLVSLSVMNIVLFILAYRYAPEIVRIQVSEQRRFANTVVWLFLLLGCFYFFRVQLMGYMRQLENKNAQLVHTIQTKRKLMSIVAHDMRGPIASLRTSMDLFMAKLLSGEEFNGVFNALSSQIDVLQSNIDTILNWSYSQTKGITPEMVRFDVVSLLNEVISFLEPQLKEKSLVLECDIPGAAIFIDADREHIRLIGRNLLNNAIKFSYPYGLINLQLEERETEVVLVIKDSGIGIPKDVQSHLFSNAITPAFGTQREKGLGLGLSLCHEFAVKNDARITVDSEPGKGTTIQLHMKAAV